MAFCVDAERIEAALSAQGQEFGDVHCGDCFVSCFHGMSIRVRLKERGRPIGAQESVCESVALTILRRTCSYTA